MLTRIVPSASSSTAPWVRGAPSAARAAPRSNTASPLVQLAPSSAERKASNVAVRDVTATGLNPKPTIVPSRNRVALLGGGSSA